MFATPAILPIEVAACATFRQSLRNLIPRIERLLQGEIRFDSSLDLMKREAVSRDGLHDPPGEIG
jgi:hypothetical protein